MIHFLRSTKLHVDCFTARRDTMEKAPIVPAIETIPLWWKDLPKERYVDNNFFPMPTMKTCAGMYDYYSKSIAIPLWSDLCVSVTNNGFEWQFSDRVSIAHSHHPHQYQGFLGKDYGHIKLTSPWYFRTKADVNWLLTNPLYNSHGFRDYAFPQGMLNFYRQYATHIQLLIDLASDKVFTIPFGLPMLLTPMTDKRIVIHRHLVDVDTIGSLDSATNTISFINKYKIKNKTTTCPYKDFLK